jgi:hypothetical protein
MKVKRMADVMSNWLNGIISTHDNRKHYLDKVQKGRNKNVTLQNIIFDAYLDNLLNGAGN